MQKKKMSNKAFAAVGTSAIALLLAALMIGNYFALTYSSIISSFLGHETYKIIQEDVDPNEDTTYFDAEFASAEEFAAASTELAKLIQEEGMVLIKNQDGAMPLGQNQRISLFSESSVDLIYGGTGSGSIDTRTVMNLKQAFESIGYTVNPTLWDFYTGNHEQYKRTIPSNLPNVDHAYLVNECPVSEYTQEVKDSYAKYNDAAIVVISRSGGEGLDLITSTDLPDGNYLALTKEERDLMTMLQNDPAFDKVIVMLNACNPLELGFLEEYSKIKACLWIGNLGQCGIESMVKAFNGEVNPSGRLVDTYAYDAFSAPAMQNFGETNVFLNGDEVPELGGLYGNEPGDIYVTYAEGIYVGYKYYETRYEDVVLGQGNAGDYNYAEQVAYPFGYGLSYTSFAYDGFKVTEQDDHFTVTLNVTNTGDVAGKDVVQIYMQSPYTDYDRENGVEKAAVQLVGFEKTAMLAPGQSETVTIEVEKSLMKAYDSHNAKTYIVDAGDYYFAFGVNAHDAINNILAAKGKTTADGMTADGNADFTYRHTEAKLDKTTYAISASGYEITNQFDDVDLNYYEGSVEGGVTYLSRSDWTGTFPSQVKVTATKQMIAEMTKVGIDEDPEAEMPVTGADNGISLISLRGVPFDDPRWEPLLDEVTVDEMYNLVRVGGYHTEPVESVGKPATTDRDGPQGISGTLGTTAGLGVSSVSYSGEIVMASSWNKDLLRRIGEMVGEAGLQMNVIGWYAPAMNIHRTPYSGRNFEYYSEDTYLSGELAAAEVGGAQSKGIFCYIKHFALNDQDAHRYGMNTYANEQSIREIYLYPFEMAISKGNATAVMTSYNRVGTVWSAADTGLITEVLRNEWGFHGTVLTDWASMYYMDVGLGLQAGNDQWLNTNGDLYTVENYKNNATFVSALRRATHNILYTAVNSAAMNGIASNTRIVTITPTWQYWLYTLDAVVVLAAALGMFGIVRRCRKNKEN